MSDFYILPQTKLPKAIPLTAAYTQIAYAWEYPPVGGGGGIDSSSSSENSR